MKFAIFIALAAVATAAPQYGYPSPTPPTTPTPTPGYSYEEPRQTYLAPGTRTAGEGEGAEKPVEAVPILRDDRVSNDDGSYTVDFETGNGIVASESGSSNSEGNFVKSGHYSYTAPDGTLVEVTYVADENGFQPASGILPELPQFVLDQIKKAAEEDAAAALRDAQPSQLYQRPQ
ncbi:cuticle protein AM/CP1114-like [Penaeus japonicus]|uniref:cuticle protein AM/CP1114-like n=1 Tax=Penaeus japonicus TaxID=27405 RepID=UPI001C7115C8|nr:cuticle protein AM/CP1114-like [Penaeus japonicus]